MGIMGPYLSASAFLRVHMAILIVLLVLLCQLSGELVNARVLHVRTNSNPIHGSNEEVRAKAILEKPGGIGNYSPAVGDDETDTQIGGVAALYNNDLDNYAGHPLMRDPRGLILRKKENLNLKHVQRIPASNGGGSKKGTPPPPDVSSDEETQESLEANREAFLELLNEHAQRPHRTRSYKKHSSKMNLKFDEKLQQWTLTEQQSEEW